ncbi:hypothetical protein DFS33DRAFT_1447422 [Desarmillaria ectypa]|nr:hypothetical protein DFS33DRAFT_1447422 [Desarmillaria ectypa]
MASTIEIPDLSDEDASIVIGVLDVYFDKIIVYALMHGVYNGSSLSPFGTSFQAKLKAARPEVRGIKAGLRTYRGVVEVIVESAALYSIALIIYISYADIITASIKGIASTLLVGRVAAGHARPNDTWKESCLSSLRFGHAARAQISTIGDISITRSVVFTDE